MQLKSVEIKNLRSLKEVKIDKIKTLNVLIGKNNSGKSNILLAVDTFFRCLNADDLFVVGGSVGRESVDFFDKALDDPIELQLCFSQSDDEMSSILSDIVYEFPQVKTAIESISLFSYLKVSVKIIYNKIAYINLIQLIKIPSTNEGKAVIFEMTDTAASELFERFKKITKIIQNVNELEKAIDRIDFRDWERYREWLSSEGRGLRRPYLEFPDSVAEAIKNSESFDEFNEMLKNKIKNLKIEKENIKNNSINKGFSSFSGEQDYIPEYARKIVEKVSKQKLLHMVERRQEIGELEINKLLDIKIRKNGGERMQVIQETIESLLGVNVDAYKPDGASMDDNSAALDVDDVLVQVNGSGIREALRLILDYEFEKPQILLIEEPEIHLHPSLELSLAKYLSKISERCQIFITTHSTNFLNIINEQNIYLITKDISTRVTLLDESEVEENIFDELGLSLSSVFMFDKLVFVEGKTDEQVLRTFASTLNINLGVAGVGFVSMNGARNLSHFANKATMNFLAKRRKKVCFLLDKDEQDEKEIQNLTDKLGDMGSIKVLNRRELENYLVCAEALAKFIKIKLEQNPDKANVPCPSIEKVKEIIAQKVELLKDIAVERLLIKEMFRPIYFDSKAVQSDSGSIDKLKKGISNQIEEKEDRLKNLKGKIDDKFNEKCEIIDKIWTSKAWSDKRDIIPGDKLLDEVCKVFGVRFQKDKGKADSPQLASLMEAHEIADEIKDFLREIVS